MFKIYRLYIIKKFFKNLIKVTTIFFCIIFIMNLFEEINFFKDTNEKIFFPIYLTLLNLPTVLFEVFPFIFLISGILFFLDIFELGEIDVIKVFGLNNSDILKILSLVAFFIGIFLITIFYSFSTSLKFKYLETKNKFTKDDKYLAVITSNGLWIRDIIDEKINFINANKISEDYLLDISISQFNDNFEIIRIINAEKALIKDNIWVLSNVTFNFENKQKKLESLMFESNFNLNKLLSIFDNLSALSLFEIEKLKEDYERLGYSTNSIENFKHKIYSYPVYLTLMLLIGSILMLNTKKNKSKIFHVIFGIMISVIIYFLSFFIKSILEPTNFSYFISIWGLQLFLFLIIAINLIRINEI